MYVVGFSLFYKPEMWTRPLELLKVWQGELYGRIRFVIEFFRQPDAHFQVDPTNPDQLGTVPRSSRWAKSSACS